MLDAAVDLYFGGEINFYNELYHAYLPRELEIKLVFKYQFNMLICRDIWGVNMVNLTRLILNYARFMGNNIR